MSEPTAPAATATEQEIDALVHQALAEQPAAPSLADRLNAAWGPTVGAWIRDRLGNSPLSRDTEAYNFVQSAMPDLLAALLKEIGQ